MGRTFVPSSWISNAFALSGRIYGDQPTQGDALGYALVAPSGRALNACRRIGTHLERWLSARGAPLTLVVALGRTLDAGCRTEPTEVE